MEYPARTTSGRGIRCTDIEKAKDFTLERLMALLALAPTTKEKAELSAREFLEEGEDIDLDDWLGYGNDTGGIIGIGPILKDAIAEIESVMLECCDDDCGEDYLLYVRKFPWEEYLDEKRAQTEEEVDGIFRKYVNMLTSEPVEIRNWNICDGE